jgi:hypothetical protein
MRKGLRGLGLSALIALNPPLAQEPASAQAELSRRELQQLDTEGIRKLLHDFDEAKRGIERAEESAKEKFEADFIQKTDKREAAITLLQWLEDREAESDQKTSKALDAIRRCVQDIQGFEEDLSVSLIQHMTHEGPPDEARELFFLQPRESFTHRIWIYRLTKDISKILKERDAFYMRFLQENQPWLRAALKKD